MMRSLPSAGACAEAVVCASATRGRGMLAILPSTSPIPPATKANQKTTVGFFIRLVSPATEFYQPPSSARRQERNPTRRRAPVVPELLSKPGRQQFFFDTHADLGADQKQQQGRQQEAERRHQKTCPWA